MYFPYFGACVYCRCVKSQSDSSDVRWLLVVCKIHIYYNLALLCTFINPRRSQPPQLSSTGLLYNIRWLHAFYLLCYEEQIRFTLHKRALRWHLGQGIRHLKLRLRCCFPPSVLAPLENRGRFWPAWHDSKIIRWNYIVVSPHLVRPAGWSWRSPKALWESTINKATDPQATYPHLLFKVYKMMAGDG